MRSEPPAATRRWWQRRGPSITVLVIVVVAMGVASLALWRTTSLALRDVGKDQQGVDPWEDPIGVEKVGQFQVARIPDCAAAPVVRIELWDADSKPYWQVVGPPTPMESFVVGVAPEGFTEEVPFRKPASDAVLRLMVVRKVKGVAGVRYQTSDLRTGYVATGEPITRYSVDNFQSASVCGNGEGEAGGTSDQVTSTTTAGG